MENYLVDYVYIIECHFGSFDSYHVSIGGIFYNEKEANKTSKQINKIGKIKAKEYRKMLYSENKPKRDDNKQENNQSIEYNEYFKIYLDLMKWDEFSESKVIKYEVNKLLLK